MQECESPPTHLKCLLEVEALALAACCSSPSLSENNLPEGGSGLSETEQTKRKGYSRTQFGEREGAELSAPHCSILLGHQLALASTLGDGWGEEQRRHQM